MRKNIITVLGAGQSLQIETVDADSFIRIYTSILVSGASHDTVIITLNGTQMALPGGTSMSCQIESLTVNSVVHESTVPAGNVSLVVFGVEQSKTLFGY